MAPGIVDVRSENMSNVPSDPKTVLIAVSTLRHEEFQYLDLIRDILQNGEHRPDRYVLWLITHFKAFS